MSVLLFDESPSPLVVAQMVNNHNSSMICTLRLMCMRRDEQSQCSPRSLRSFFAWHSAQR